MKRTKLILVGITSLVLLIFAASLAFWVASTKEPSRVALASLESNPNVIITQEPGLIVFEPIYDKRSTGVVFYPGAGVDFRAYAPLLRRIAEGGYLVAIPQMPLNIAFFKPRAADEVIQRYPEIHAWFVAGHSLGGVVAAQYAAGHADVKGLVLWASYPSGDALRISALPVLSISASNDGLTTSGDIVASRALLPEETWFVEIPGGNHAQFGSYGTQQGDGDATISAESQWAVIVEATLSFLGMGSN